MVAQCGGWRSAEARRKQTVTLRQTIEFSATSTRLSQLIVGKLNSLSPEKCLFAEQEVMQHLVDTLEELLDQTGLLFGTSAWLMQETHFSRTSTMEEGDHGWYSTFRLEEE